MIYNYDVTRRTTKIVIVKHQMNVAETQKKLGSGKRSYHNFEDPSKWKSNYAGLPALDLGQPYIINKVKKIQLSIKKIFFCSADERCVGTKLVLLIFLKVLMVTKY
jgi:hypothetical protein